MKRSRREAQVESDGREPARASEALLIELLPEVRGTRLLCTSAGRAQLAEAAARGDPARHVACWFLDLHQAAMAREACERGGGDAAAAAAPSDVAVASAPAQAAVADAPFEMAVAAAPADDAVAAAPANLAIECSADLPDGPFDVALIPMRAGADSELAWELLQQAHTRIETGGRLFASVDEPKDRWVAGRMDALFDGRVTRKASRDAIAYSGVKRGPLKKEKRFECEFAFRDEGRLIRVVSRPGVFSHRRLDLGARALIESLVERDGRGRERALVQPGMSVLDLGCGAGAVGFAAALRAEGVRLHAVDSMPRAIECARLGAEKNGLGERFSAQATAEGAIEGNGLAGSFDLVLGNPPYYSQHAISEVFARAALVALKPGGRAHFVTRQPEWFAERMAREFKRVRVSELRTYSVVSGARASV